MEYLLAFVGMTLFWPVLLTACLTLTLAVVCEKGALSTLALLCLATLVVLKWPAFFASVDWLAWIFAVIAFFLIGVVWAVFKWRLYVSKRFDEILDARNDFLKRRTLPLDYFTNFKAKLAEYVENTPDLEHQFKDPASPILIFDKYANECSSNGFLTRVPYNWDSSPDVLNAAMAPVASDHKQRIVMCIVYWPISAVWYVVGDLLKDLGKHIYKLIGNWLQSIADDKFKKL